jgi:hypothetical protein
MLRVLLIAAIGYAIGSPLVAPARPAAVEQAFVGFHEAVNASLQQTPRLAQAGAVAWHTHRSIERMPLMASFRSATR